MMNIKLEFADDSTSIEIFVEAPTMVKEFRCPVGWLDPPDEVGQWVGEMLAQIIRKYLARH